MKNKMIRIAAGAMALVLLLAACGPTKMDMSKPVAKVYDEPITLEQYQKEADLQMKLYAAQFGAQNLDMPSQDGQTVRDIMYDRVLGLMIMYRLMEKDLKDQNMSITSEQIDAEIERVKKEELGGDEGYKEALERTKMTEEEFRLNTADNLLYKTHKEWALKDMEVSDEELNAAYEANKQNYDKIRASHILVETEEEAKAVASRLEKGEDFAEVAKEVSMDEGSKVNGGDLGEFNQTRMVPEFGEAAFALEEGQVSEPVQSQFGWHIIKVTERNVGLEPVREQVKAAALETKYVEYLAGKEKEASVERFEDVLNDVKKEAKAALAATEAPATEGSAPATEAPVTEAPATETPATEAP